MATVAATAALMAASGFTYEPHYECAACVRVSEGAKCEEMNACAAVPNGVKDCVGAGHCSAEQMYHLRNKRPLKASTRSVRVTKGFGTKDYPMLRLSVITDKDTKLDGFDYSAQFKYKWTGNAIHTKLVPHPNPGGSATFDLGGTNVTVKLPASGKGSAGLIVGDPCRKGSAVGCTNEAKFQTTTRFPEMVNAIMGHDDADWWGILGDNFYDQSGSLTAEVFDELSAATLQKPMHTVPGNHDYWVLGSPIIGTGADQYANGHMQWYAQDAKCSESVMPGAKGVSPFDFSIPPEHRHLPSINNSFWYNQMGNIGMVGYSGAYGLSQTKSLMQEACTWLGKNHRSQGGDVDVAVIVGHWDVGGLGASKDMAGPGFYDHMKVLSGCDVYEKNSTLKFFMGHTHCNVPHPHGHVGAGFMVAGQGMSGCGNFGFPIIDTTENRFRVYHFEVYSKDGKDTYAEKLACIKEKGWRGCTAMADVWIDQAL
eukprot:TRINITY_DN779_c0_g1_i2.p2 TRINITY_DN779_c0_g1~~TRINITY_DN779_c0_g1_i2.p2  ORF type:complete len:482 (+),score=191.85 TRINITY_DN779_c0_g1_i2:64-1509(+)